MAFNQLSDPDVGSDNSVKHIDFIGKIRDPIHNTISYSEIEKEIIDSRWMQRLRRIKQTAFANYVFPGASHSRFEHSLGTMNISGLILSSIIKNQRSILKQLSFSLENISYSKRKIFEQKDCQNFSILSTEGKLCLLEKKPYLQQILRLAGLLHDVGHSPLSHSGENFMISWEDFFSSIDNIKLSDWMKEGFENKKKKLSARKKSLLQNMRHEVYTIFIVNEIFNTELRNCDENLARDICAILDTAFSPSPGGLLEESGLRNLFHDIVSGELDADRMDYLLRDSRECGVVYGLFDLGRILDSVGFYINVKTKESHLAIRRSGIPAFEDFLRARLSMYGQVYFHKTSTACEAMLLHLKKQLIDFRFPLDLEKYMNFDDHNFFSLLKHEIQRLNENNEYLEKISEDVLLNRSLWKRIYEEKFSHQKNKPSDFFRSIVKNLKKMNVPYEIIESCNNLTNFLPEGIEHSENKNHIKVIIKDFKGLRFIEKIDQHSQLINNVDEHFSVRRIFVGKYNQNKTQIDLKKIKEQIFEF